MPVHNITVPYVDLAEFDWSFTRSGPLPWNRTVWYAPLPLSQHSINIPRAILAVFTAVPLWMTIELTVWVFYAFRRWSGLYFWSVLICTWGVTLHAIGFILKFCVPSCNWIVSVTLAEIGWVSMVTGFSVVLYSRLHLVVRSQRILKFVLIMVITDAFLFHVPTIIFQYGVSNKSSHTKYLPFMAPMERVQVLGFSIQEVLISAIYIWATMRMLKGSFNKKIRNTIMFLILIQVVVILADIIVITLDYCEYFTLKAVLHSFVYAFKLQLEFVILNQFKDVIANGGIAPRGLEAMQQEQNGGLSPTAPLKATGSPRKWGSFITIGRVGTQETDRSKGETSGSVTAKGATTPPRPDVKGVKMDPNQISTYVPGQTDTLDIERQYLGAWDRPGMGERV